MFQGLIRGFKVQVQRSAGAVREGQKVLIPLFNVELQTFEDQGQRGLRVSPLAVDVGHGVSPSMLAQFVSYVPASPDGFLGPAKGLIGVSHTAVVLGYIPKVTGLALPVVSFAVYSECLEVRLQGAGVVLMHPADIGQLPIGSSFACFIPQLPEDGHRRLSGLYRTHGVREDCQHPYTPDVDLRKLGPVS